MNRSAWQPLLILPLLLCFAPARAEERLRIERPKETEVPLVLVSRLPEEGLYKRWHRNYVIPTICPVNRCHGTCASSGQGCSMRLNSLDLFFDECVEAGQTESLSAERATCCQGGKP